MAEVWTIQKILDWTSTYFTSKSISSARLDAELLLANVLNCNRLDLYLQFERILTPQERTRYREFVQRRTRREPVQYILGVTEFHGLVFEVTPDVLIPRPETELLVETVLENSSGLGRTPVRILDVGTGSGCIAVSLAKESPSAEIWAMDSSPEALAVARRNAERHGVEIHFLLQDVFQPFKKKLPQFDIVVSNPPYVTASEENVLPPEVKNYEPPEALFAAGDGLDFYRQFIKIRPQILASEGLFILEMGYEKANSINKLFTEQGYQTHVKNDYAHIERVIIAHTKEKS